MYKLDVLKSVIEESKEFLERSLKPNEMILDGEVIDAKTFETIRLATEAEIYHFYTIRISEMQIRNIEDNIKDEKFDINDVVKSKDNKTEGVIIEIQKNENNENIYAVYGYTILKWFLAEDLVLIRKGNKNKNRY